MRHALDAFQNMENYLVDQILRKWQIEFDLKEFLCEIPACLNNPK